MDQPFILLVFLVVFLILWLGTLITFVISAAKPIWLIGLAVFLMGLMGVAYAPMQIGRLQRRFYTVSAGIVLLGLILLFVGIPSPSMNNTLGPRPTATHTVIPTVTLTPGPYISPTPTRTRTPTPLPKALVSKLSINVRSGPGLDFPVIEVLSEGNEVGVVSRTADNKWIQVQTQKGNKGWVAITLLDVTQLDLNTIPMGGTPAP